MGESTRFDHGLAGAVRVVVDAVRTTFGLAVIVEMFLGIALLAVIFKMGEPPSPQLLWLAIGLALAMVAILALVFAIRLWRPFGLSAPPETSAVEFSESSIEDAEGS